MDKEKKLKEKVMQKVRNEFNDYVENLKKCSPEEILGRAYEKVTKQELIYALDKKELSIVESKALLKSEELLDDFYDEWIDKDGDFNDMLEYTIDDRVDGITEEYQENNRQKNRDSR